MPSLAAHKELMKDIRAVSIIHNRGVNPLIKNEVGYCHTILRRLVCNGTRKRSGPKRIRPVNRTPGPNLLEELL